MKKIKNTFLAFFVTVLTSLNLVLPTYAEETTAQTVNTAGFSVVQLHFHQAISQKHCLMEKVIMPIMTKVQRLKLFLNPMRMQLLMILL